MSMNKLTLMKGRANLIIVKNENNKKESPQKMNHEGQNVKSPML